MIAKYSSQILLFILLLTVTGGLVFPSTQAKVNEPVKQRGGYPEDVRIAADAITGERLMAHVGFLASEFCRGRGTGDKGLDLAARYITAIYKGDGIKGAARSNSFFQTVPLETMELDDRVRLLVEKKSSSSRSVKTARLNQHFLPTRISGEMEVTAPVVFAGYGITAPEHKYDDYKNIDARGKIVLVMRHEPGEKDGKSPFNGKVLSKYGTLLSKIRNAQEHGAAGLMFVTDPLNHDDRSVKDGIYFSGTWWPALRRNKNKHKDDFKYMRFNPVMKLTGRDFGVHIPTVHIDGELADFILGTNRSLKKIQTGIDKTLKPRSFSLGDTRVTLDIFFRKKPVDAYNIAAVVEGSDPELRKEVVIIMAHYDHLGKDNRGQFYPGAEDNASGTAAVIELARAFQQLKKKPKRTVLFLLLTAEEKGLLGSTYYAGHPLYPLEKTVAVFNLDMIGCNDPKQIGIVGKYQYPKLFKIVEKVNHGVTGFDINYENDLFITNSDHFAFFQQRVPGLMFDSGLTDHYHQVTDTPDKLNPAKVRNVTRLAFYSLWEIAELPAGTRLK